jgi:hypothetical protein
MSQNCSNLDLFIKYFIILQNFFCLLPILTISHTKQEEVIKMKILTKRIILTKKILSSFVMLITVSATQAALPPDFQNEKDLADVVSYIKSDHEVLSNLRVIDIAEKTVYYGDSCRVQFARKVVEREEGWVGPAEPLEFKSKECADTNIAQMKPFVPEGKVGRGVIFSAVVGDTACYLQIKDESGMTHDEMASFGLCEEPELLHQPSEFAYERANVIAASCEGSPECTETDEVWLIVVVNKV